MKRRALLVVLLASAVVAQDASRQPQQEKQDAWRRVEQVLGVKGELKDGDVFHVSFPRSDLEVKVKDVQVQPGFALGSWLAFKFFGQEAIAMGDLVLTESEVFPVIRKLQQVDIEVSALHNHLLHESKDVMYMHVMGRGNPEEIARKIKSALAETGTPWDNQKPTSRDPQTSLDQENLQQILRAKATLSGGILKFSFPRPDTIEVHGHAIPASMGLAIVINFQPVAQCLCAPVPS